MASSANTLANDDRQHAADHPSIAAMRDAADLLQQLRASLTLLEKCPCQCGVAAAEILALHESLAAIYDKLRYAALHRRTKWRVAAWASFLFPYSTIKELACRMEERSNAEEGKAPRTDLGLYRELAHVASCLEWTLPHRQENDLAIFVKTMTGKTIQLRVDPLASIRDLKQAVHEREGPPVDDIMLIWASKRLDDARLVAELGLRNESFIHMAIPCRWRGIRTHGG